MQKMVLDRAAVVHGAMAEKARQWEQLVTVGRWTTKMLVGSNFVVVIVKEAFTARTSQNSGESLHLVLL